MPATTDRSLKLSFCLIDAPDNDQPNDGFDIPHHMGLFGLTAGLNMINPISFVF